ncbi:hypothetical protein MX026_10860 [Streptococcus uberis]|nr:hypothetical protein [Streptococcus uberis]
MKDFRNLAYHNYGAIRIQVLLRTSLEQKLTYLVSIFCKVINKF